MRPGRPLTAFSVGAAILGASLVAAPALADESTDSQFDITTVADVVNPADTALAVSGVGCTGTNATVGVALLPPGSNDVSGGVTVTPAADGSWSTTLDVAAAIKASGGDPNQDGWSVGAACGTYNGVTGADAEAVVFDNTEVTGSYTITGEAGAQTIAVEVGGFSSGETATVTLNAVEDNSVAATLGEMTIDQDGKGTGSFPAPTSIPDGTYRLVITGSRYGETAGSIKLIQVSGGTYSAVEDNSGKGGQGNDGTVGSTGTDGATHEPAASQGSGATVSVTAGATQAAAPARGNSALARTGANGLLFGGIALALVAIGGGVLYVRRRKA
ncbi:LPXTG cell wall anchor domain-containing protein [Actinomyces bowdenii]|uniref:LPXTG cell wall anchor domain-containing protein n=1 Tax=Actinomyces bowdenii TaxID=131109 RepID=UPI001ABD3420|nr:LPXTG cell wall anchor domain-containing protein [Actinomyces bowdenii]MBO3725788.1 LPXTG cell wall anchor domain-containing protein [Actinomyces bowdenii]